jgi:ABC-type Fe3+ transport system substrate-binding protein
MGQRLAVIIALVLVLSLPFIVRATSGARGRGAEIPEGSPKLVVITPHVEQIRDEFGRAFDRWYFREHGSHVDVDWRTPGGTSDIIKQLEATLEAAAKNGLIDAEGRAQAGAAGCDLFFGGGSYEHGKLKDKKKAMGPAGQAVEYRMAQPAKFEQKQLDEWFGENKIGVQKLYDPEQYWIGTALSGFGIVYNRDVLRRIGVEKDPTSFHDLCDFRLLNLVALADSRQSGSIQTTFDSILNKEGWDGWRTLREMCGNARYFASSSTKPPIDVSQGDAAAGLAIDFYGRYQGQGLMRPGDDPSKSRVGYVDPAGAVYIDADPATILNGAANFDLARAFVEFCLTEEAQALWQFPPIAQATADTPTDASGRKFGPDEYALRRMPVRRVMYEKYARFFVDKSNPFEAASDVKSNGWRSSIPPMMAAFGIDTAPEVRAAWKALNEARSQSGFPAERLAEMEKLFYSMPMHTFREGGLYALPQTLEGMSANARKELRKKRIATFEMLANELASEKSKGGTEPGILADWQKVIDRRDTLEPKSSGVSVEFTAGRYSDIDGDTDSWKDLDHGKRSLIAYTKFFREQYKRVVELREQGGAQ